MKKVLVTGANGFIGRHCLPLLRGKGYEVHAVSTRPVHDHNATGVAWHQADLLDPKVTSSILARIKPTHLLHLAWYAEPVKFWTAPENLQWLQASLHLMQEFARDNGQRIVMAGSCAEYDWRYGYCSELLTPTRPTTLYGECKNAVRSVMERFCIENGISGAWGRIFLLYGPHEHPDRLVSSVIRSLIAGKPSRCSHGNQVRDFLHVEDVASAFLALLDSSVAGPVNIASGQPVAIKNIVQAIAGNLSRQDLVELGGVPVPADDPPLLVADVHRLSDEVGWRPRFDLAAGLDQTIRWWRSHMARENE